MTWIELIYSLPFMLMGGCIFSFADVVSWFILRGKCRRCRRRIPLRYPVTAAMGMAAAALCLQYFGAWNGSRHGITSQAVIVFLLLTQLWVIAQVDQRTMEIPNGLVFFCMALAVVSAFFFPQVTLVERLIGSVSVSVPLFLITLAVPGAFGGGDMKLMAALGFFLGWKMSLTAFALAVFAGGIYGIILLASKKKSGKEHFAFGPFLCAGTAIAVFWGEKLLVWYISIVF